ncbi:MAG: cyclic nucleotide-binding domain-containing protein [Burkholderiaceae bacterium]|nr:cyclic nucleotide-binding domain-containing protein [Burkholderiaceae bacterium]
MFNENVEGSDTVVSWAQRGAEVGAQPFDAAIGKALFTKLWGADKHLAALDDADLSRLSEFLLYVKLPSNQEVVKQDEQGDYMVVVLEGTLAVDRLQPWGGRARLAEARVGDMLGEMSLLDAGARFSACTTLTACTLAVLDAQALDRLMAEEPRLAAALLASLARRLSLSLRQVSARLGALLSRD